MVLRSRVGVERLVGHVECRGIRQADRYAVPSVLPLLARADYRRLTLLVLMLTEGAFVCSDSRSP